MYYIGFDIGGSSTKAVLVKDKQILKSLVEDTPEKVASTFLAVVARMYFRSRTLSLGLASSVIATTPATFGVAELVPFIVAVYWQFGAKAFAPLASSGLTADGYLLLAQPVRLVVTMAGAKLEPVPVV